MPRATGVESVIHTVSVQKSLSFDEDRYKKRNTVERAINKVKNHRAVAIRYDKRGNVLLGTVTAAAVVVRLRS